MASRHGQSPGDAWHLKQKYLCTYAIGVVSVSVLIAQQQI
jgi:hypothetical protein